MRFAISFSAGLRWLFRILGATTRNSAVEVTPTAVIVRMGWLFSMHAQRTAMRGARRERDVWWGIGVRTDFRGRWIVNGSARNIVAIDLDPGARAWFLAVLPVRVRRLSVSVDDPDALLAALSP